MEDFHNNNSSKHPIIDFSSGIPDVETFPYKNFQHCLNKSIELYKEKLFTLFRSPWIKFINKGISKTYSTISNIHKSR